MRLHITKQALKDTARIKKELMKAAQDIRIDAQNKIQEVGNLGFNFAYNLAPEFRGDLKNAMRVEISPDQFVIVSAHPQGDAVPTHILFDEGIYPNPRVASSLGFMKQTEAFLQQEFPRRLGLAIQRSIEKIGGIER